MYTKALTSVKWQWIWPNLLLWLKRSESVEQNSWCWHDVPCTCVLEVLCKSRSILGTWTECSLEARAVKWTSGAHHLVCYQGTVVVLCAPRHVLPYGSETCFKNSIPLIEIKKLRQIHPNMLLNYYHGPAAHGYKLCHVTLPHLRSTCGLLPLQNKPQQSCPHHIHFICWRRGGKCNSHFFNLICRLDIKEVGNMCLMTSGYAYAWK